MSRLQELLDTALSIQQGESYPERHIANVDRLQNEYSEYENELIDFLYRIAIHLYEYSETFSHKIVKNEITMSEAIQTLKISFSQFSTEAIYYCIEAHFPVDFDDYETLENCET